MNGRNESIEPVTDLGLNLAYSNQFAGRTQNNDSGVGANAGSSMVDMTFVATDPLSELVWSPHNGLSLKCADSSFVEKNSMSRDVGLESNNVTLALPHHARTSAAERPLEDENFVASQSPLCLKSDHDSKDTLNSYASGDLGVMPLSGSEHVADTEKDELHDSGEDESVPVSIQRHREPEIREKEFSSLPGHVDKQIVDIERDEHKPDLAQHKPSSVDVSVRDRHIGSGNLTLGMNNILASEVHPLNEYRPSISLAPAHNLFGIWPLEKLESTAENDSRNMTGENAGGERSKIVLSESAREVKNSQHGKIHSRDKDVPSDHPPTNSEIRMKRRKGKEKALSDGDVNDRISIEKDNSHESVESCNSAGLFSTGKNGWSFEQQLIVGRKRVKQQFSDNPCSSKLGRDSSFINWISNMVKGFPKNIQDESPSIALSLAHTYNEHELPSQELMTSKKSYDPKYKSSGFQSLFESLYGPTTKADDKICDVNTTPIACHGKNGNFSKQFLLTNEKFHESTSENGASAEMQLKIIPENSTDYDKNFNTESENKNSDNPVVIGHDKDEISSYSSMGKRKRNKGKNVESDLPFEEKTNQNFGNTSDPVRNLWTARLSKKTSGPLLNQDLKELSAENQKTVVRNELQSWAANPEGSSGLNIFKGHNDQKLMCKLNPILSLPIAKSSEAMASVFARRLDALRHIIPSNGRENEGCETVTCFFCGTRGHHLQDCSEISESEVEGLSRNFDLLHGRENEGRETVTCLCIRCFQPNHWAVSCPNADSMVRYQSEFRPTEIKLISRSGLNQNLLIGDSSKFQTSAQRHSQNLEGDIILNGRLDQNISSENFGYDTNAAQKCVASTCMGKNSKENEAIPSSYVYRQISNAREGIFYAIKRLRLSRTDILKWMNTKMPLSHLDGFFLRVRLGKWEEGLGGTGYYVACIKGAQKETNSISVNVGEINCFVQSQYVSNHDFLLDELMAWWCATSRDCSKVLDEADLSEKLMKKKLLGL